MPTIRATNIVVIGPDNEWAIAMMFKTHPTIPATQRAINAKVPAKPNACNNFILLSCGLRGHVFRIQNAFRSHYERFVGILRHARYAGCAKLLKQRFRLFALIRLEQ